MFGVEVAGVEAAAAGVEAFGSAAARLGIPAWSEISLKVRCSGRFAGFAGVLEVPTPGFLVAFWKDSGGSPTPSTSTRIS